MAISSSEGGRSPPERLVYIYIIYIYTKYRYTFCKNIAFVTIRWLRGMSPHCWPPQRVNLPTKSTSGHLTAPSQASHGPTNQRPGTLQTHHRPRRGRQINARAPYRHLTGLARDNQSTSGHLTDAPSTLLGPRSTLLLIIQALVNFIGFLLNFTADRHRKLSNNMKRR